MSPVLIVVLVVALAALGVSVYVATRPPPTPPAGSDPLGGVVGTILHLAGV